MCTWHNTTICTNLCGSLKKRLFGTANQDRYDIIRAIFYYETANKTVSDSVISGGGRPIPRGSTTDVIYFLVSTLWTHT